jgi:hypothetical protein
LDSTITPAIAELARHRSGSSRRQPSSARRRQLPGPDSCHTTTAASSVATARAAIAPDTDSPSAAVTTPARKRATAATTWPAANRPYCSCPSSPPSSAPVTTKGTSIAPSQTAGHTLSRWKKAFAAGDSRTVRPPSPPPTARASSSPDRSLVPAASRYAAVRRASTYCMPPAGMPPISPTPSSAPSAPYSAGPNDRVNRMVSA